MLSRVRILAFAALTAACQAGPQEVSAVSQGGPSSSAIKLTVNLVELSENPTPVGLPMSLVIDAPRLPRVQDERVAVTWRAADGEAGPRDGSGSLEMDPQGRLLATLTASGRASTEVLTLSGTESAGTVRGTFSDRLFFRRAGRFEGQIREQ